MSLIPVYRSRPSALHTARAGVGAAYCGALALTGALFLHPRANELVWIVTALDDDGLAAGVRALDERKLRNAFAVAATGDRVEKLPLVGR